MTPGHGEELRKKDPSRLFSISEISSILISCVFRNSIYGQGD